PAAGAFTTTMPRAALSSPPPPPPDPHAEETARSAAHARTQSARALFDVGSEERGALSVIRSYSL
ncbi:MAG TPA: hypothetical protein VJ715_13585, partial [Pyrinomonadaceae bacterium]|nr:hypothetical protein [Pyrinomonadaceae bacterium]